MLRAVVYERPNSSKWYIAYWDARQGRRVHAPTQFRKDDPSGKKRALMLASDKDRENAVYASYSKRELWEVWVSKFLEDRYRRNPKTLTRYVNAWDWLRVFLAEHKIVHPEAMTYNLALAYLDWRTQCKRHCGKPITRNTAMTEMKIMGVIMGEAVKRGYARTNPCTRMGLKRDDPAEKPEITDEEAHLIRQLLAEKEGALALPERWMTIAFEVAMHHGCRLSETQVPMTAVDLRLGTIRFSAKRGKVFTVRIHPALVPLLTALKRAGATHTCKHPPMASKAWHTFFKGRDELAHLCFHCTRVTVITRLARAGVPIQQAMAYVGHSSQAVHRIYQRLKADDLSLCTQALAYGIPARPQRSGESGEQSEAVPSQAAS